MMKLICEMGDESHKSLLIQLPKHLIEKINVDVNGEIDTDQFLGLLLQHYLGKNHQKQNSINWYEIIFDTSQAVLAGTARTTARRKQ